MATPRRITPYDDRIPPDLWIEFPRADLRRRLIEAVRAIARLRGATSLDVQEALCAAWNVPPVGSVFGRLAHDLARYDLAYFTVQWIAGKQKITLFQLTERGRTLARALGVEPVENRWNILMRTHQGEKQVKYIPAWQVRFIRRLGYLFDSQRSCRLHGAY